MLTIKVEEITENKVAFRSVGLLEAFRFDKGIYVKVNAYGEEANAREIKDNHVRLIKYCFAGHELVELLPTQIIIGQG